MLSRELKTTSHQDRKRWCSPRRNTCSFTRQFTICAPHRLKHFKQSFTKSIRSLLLNTLNFKWCHNLNNWVVRNSWESLTRDGATIRSSSSGCRNSFNTWIDTMWKHAASQIWQIKVSSNLKCMSWRNFSLKLQKRSFTRLKKKDKATWLMLRCWKASLACTSSWVKYPSVRKARIVWLNSKNDSWLLRETFIGICSSSFLENSHWGTTWRWRINNLMMRWGDFNDIWRGRVSSSM